MLFYLLVLALALREPEDLAYPWSYAGVIGVIAGIIAKFKGATFYEALLTGAIVYVYFGLILWWLSKQTRYSFFWWIALLLALAPEVVPRLLAKH